MRRIVFLHCDFFYFFGDAPSYCANPRKASAPGTKQNERPRRTLSPSPQQNSNRRPPKIILNYLHFAIDKRTKLCYNCITTNSTVDTVRG